MSTHTLMFGWEYPPLHTGGLGVACQGLVQGLLQNGVRITLVLPHPNPKAEEEDLDVRSPHSSTLQHLHIQSLLVPYQSQKEYLLSIKRAKQGSIQIYGDDLGQAIASYIEASIDITKDVRPDVVHCHDWMTYEAGRRAAAYHRTPLVAHIHATELDRTHFHPNEYIFTQERRGFEASDKVIAVSNYTKNMVVEHYGISPEKISVIHNGNRTTLKSVSHITSRARDRGYPLVLFLGRLVTQKGTMQFLDMAAAIHELRPDVRFVLAGEGDMLGQLVERTYTLGLRDCVSFTGKLENSEVEHLYAQADCFVMPSLSEPFGLVALEAIAHGTPVVLSRQSGAREVIDHCFAVDFWDTEKLADCVLTILRETPLAEQLVSQAPRTLTRLTWKKQAAHIESIYRDLITCQHNA